MTAAVAQGRHGPPGLAPAATYREVAALFGALADPTRMAIVHALSVREACTNELAAIVGVTESGVSQHLRILRALRLAKARRAGKYVYYTLDDAHVAALLHMALTHHGHTAQASEAARA
ncbi:MAG: metalloregulator ArsR/SmtB family transcription factor [Candidatus Eremiobacteraeota bacterium]|nr:metalloregulator ArsR/SmtB family transcription factor [Candidatus Eremiobacteraeota bacterium]